jgi:hypothetical protein
MDYQLDERSSRQFKGCILAENYHQFATFHLEMYIKKLAIKAFN